jgi:T5SS/PEP-CTERM-associated repeat protein
VPGANDRAIFNDSAAIVGYAVGLNLSNDVVGNVLFSPTTKSMFWKNNTNTLTILNNFVMDEGASGTATNTLRTGYLAVTNSSGTGTFQVGNYSDGGRGVLIMMAQGAAGNTYPTNYPTLIANNFLVTSNSTALFEAGTLTTYGGSIDRGTNVTLTTTSYGLIPTVGAIFTWNILGGTNTVTYLGSGTNNLGYVTGSGTLDINVGGSGTLWALPGNETDVGYNSTNAVNLTISGGAVMTNGGNTYISRNGSGCSNNTVVVTGAGSQWQYGINLIVGNAAMNNSLTISAGGVVTGGYGYVGNGAASSNSVVTVIGTNSAWKSINVFEIGVSAPACSLIISNGGQVVNVGTLTLVGGNATSTGDTVFVDGAGSVWSVANPGSHLNVGNNGPFSSVTVKNGGQVISSGVNLGDGSTASNCTVLVTGTNSLWNNSAGNFYIGVAAGGNQLIITNGGQLVTQSIPLGTANAAGNAMVVAGGTVFGTNSVSGGVLSVGSGGQTATFTFNGGAVTVDQVILTNGAASVFNFNSGVLNVKTSMVANGSAFVVGDGADTATLNLLEYSHTYANGLSISSNATLSGVGTIVGNATVANGATLAPGPASGVGTLTLANNLIVNNNSTLQYGLGTNSDRAVVSGNLTLGGTLNVNDAGGFGVGTYTLFTYAGGLTDNGVAIGTTPNAGLYYAIDTGTVGQVNLDVSYTAPAGPITGSSSVNAGDSGDSYSISSVTDATTYTWSVPSGATITSGQGTTSIIVNYGCSAVSGSITVTPSNINGSGAPSSLGVTVTGVGAAGSVTGSSAVNAGDSGDTYSISSVSGASTYTWTVPSGATIASGQGTTSITVNYSCSAVSGSVQVTPSNANGCAGGSASLPVTVTGVGAAGSITGSSAVNAGDSGDVYSISSVSGASTYTWTVPSGATIASGQGTTSITVNYSCSAVSGSVQVTPSNANGCTGGAGSLPVTVTGVDVAGSISGPTVVCAGTSGQVYSISAVNGATTYTWSVPSDATITSGQGSTSITVTWGSTTGNVSVTPANGNGCTGGAGNLSVTVNPLPPTPTAGNNGPIIEGNILNLTASTIAGVTYNWSGPNSFASTDQNPSISNATSAASGVYLVTVTDSNGCTSAAGSTTALVTALRTTAITAQGNDIQITWATTGGTTNAVQVTGGAADGSYNTNGFADIAGSLTIIGGSGDTSTNYTDVGGATNAPSRYYRVRLVP